jgi:hypothetical protein
MWRYRLFTEICSDVWSVAVSGNNVYQEIYVHRPSWALSESVAMSGLDRMLISLLFFIMSEKTVFADHSVTNYTRSIQTSRVRCDVACIENLCANITHDKYNSYCKHLVHDVQ